MKAAATRQLEERAKLVSELALCRSAKADADRTASENAALLRSLAALAHEIDAIYDILRNGGYGSVPYAEWMNRAEKSRRRERGPSADQERVLDPSENEVMTLHPNPKCCECGAGGDLVFGPNPYEAEINDNATPVWMCPGCLDEAEGAI